MLHSRAVDHPFHPESRLVLPDVTVGEIGSRYDLFKARAVLKAYAASPEGRLERDAVAADLADLADSYAPPGGAFLLAKQDGLPLGGVGLRSVAFDVAEMKRLFVLPRHRSRGIGRLLAERLVRVARARGYRALRLEVPRAAERAVGLYRRLGFMTLPDHRGVAYIDLMAMELPLR